LHYVLSYGAIALVAVGYLTRQNAAHMAYLLPVFFVCVFPHGKWQPAHPIVQALPFFPSDGHVVADMVALSAVTAVVIKMFRPCAFLAWALVLTHFLPCKCGFVVPPSSTLLSSTVHALHYVALIDIPVIILYIIASPRAPFLSHTSFSQMWRLVKVHPLRPYFSPSTFCGQRLQSRRVASSATSSPSSA
jgi:hypothetical protein